MATGSRRIKSSPRHQRGFTYVGLMIMVAILGIASAAALQTGALVQRRAAEEELLAIGMEFRNALISYANATPSGLPRAPASLYDLLRDPRYPGIRRHLRKMYADPITGKEEWGTVIAPDGSGVIGVYSLSNAKPIKIAHFDSVLQDFEGRNSYQEWKFVTPAQELQAGRR